ncbi:TIM barrel protein [Tundrisphaera sp. TA3]|uniref:TIM barrel protein n=1 Tax=Tundrisphaera sp. TA3 TaxID=3435775 RepID=UPI003EB86A57
MTIFARSLLALLALASAARGAGPPFDRGNLVAWCIVPFDSQHRGPEDRAAMLERLGFARYAYDWRAEHLPSFDAELDALAKHHVTLSAVWFPAALDKDARTILDALGRRQIHTQLWVTMGDPAPGKDQAAKVEAAANQLRPIVDAAAKIGCSVGLYNHGSWFGEPENELAIIAALGRPNVGIVYNLHHGHDHLDRFPSILRKLQPHLYAINLNGMVRDGEKLGRKILPLGQGDQDLALLRAIRESGYRGPIGILGHTQDDAEARLRDNLDGLDWLTPQLEGRPAGPKPTPRTPVAAAPAERGTGWVIAGRPEYRSAPLMLTLRARLDGAADFNILAACDPKASGNHWELFTWPGTGALTAYLPGRVPDHVRSDAAICDGKSHELGLRIERDRVILTCDGKTVGDQPVTMREMPAKPGDLAFGRLAEGGIGCDGAIESATLTRGDERVGDWRFDPAGAGPAEDRSPLRNPARSARPTRAGSVEPPAGDPLQPVDPRLKVARIDRAASDAYMAVKVDGAGSVFVGGRASVYAFDPDRAGGYGPRQEILRFPDPSVIIGLEFRGDDLYVLTASALYLVPGGRVRREGLVPRRLVWGLPLDYHVSFHCLAWGLDGDLYLTHGDPLLNYGLDDRPDHWGHWVLHSQPEGTEVPYTGSGAVLRVRPDGSGLRVVAGGLRGPVGLAFDPAGNLFTNDNDHESRADLYAPARLLHASPGADFGWPRGWMASMSPDRADLLEPMIATLGRGVPCDLAYADGPAPGLLMCRWDRMAVNLYALEPRGASFAAVEKPFLQGRDDARPVGVAVGPDGRVYVTSLYLAGNVVTPECPSDLVVISDGKAPASARDVAALPDPGLWDELASPSTTRRWRAHGEILRRGGPLLDDAARRLGDAQPGDPARVHLAWLAAAGGSDAAGRVVRSWAADPDPALRLQAVRILSEFPRLNPTPDTFARALDDADPRVALAALGSYLGSTLPPPTPPVARLAASPDTYLRQAASRLLALRANLDELNALRADASPAARLAGVLAAGARLTVVPTDDRPPSAVPLFFPADNPFFHGVISFAAPHGAVNLRDLGPIGSYTTAQRWKAVAPTADQLALVDLLSSALSDPDARVVSQSAFFLGLLRDPAIEPRVASARRDLRTRALAGAPDRPIPRAWALATTADLPIPAGPGGIDPAVSQPSPAGPIPWLEASGDGGRFDGPAGYRLFRLESPAKGPAFLLARSPAPVAAWHDDRPLEPPVDGRISLDLRPGRNDILVRVGDRVELRYRAPAEVAATLPERRDAAPTVAAAAASDFARVDWPEAARRGDPARGRALFESIGCARCHAVAPGQAGGGGPSLADARGRLTVPHLVESILDPDRQVADPFKATQIATADGRVRSGLILSEDADRLELLLPDASRETIPKADLEERSAAPHSPMPAGLVRTPDDLKHLLAYLLADRPKAP